MTFGSEWLAILEDFAKRQKQLYRSSADFGIRVTAKQHKLIRKCCGELSLIYKNSKKVYNYTTGSTKKWETFIPIEYNDYDSSKINGILLEVTHVTGRYRGRTDQYFEIFMTREDRDASVEYMKEVK